jgi:murein L,D-transpeptidase YcbB/YkuD
LNARRDAEPGWHHAARGIHVILLLLFAVSLAAGQTRTPAAGTSLHTAAATLHAMLAEGRHPDLKWGYFAHCRKHLETLYEEYRFQPIWTRDSKPTGQALAVIEALAGAAETGLDPADYDAGLLVSKSQMLEKSAETSPAELALFDAALSIALMRYIADLHVGRINPKNLNFGLNIEAKKYDLPELVKAMVDGNRVGETLRGVEPDLPVYHRLKEALARYRTLAEDRTLTTLPDLVVLHPGDRHTGVPALRRLLTALGDLHRDQEQVNRGEDDLYSGTLVEAVKVFQRRHGLSVDGVVGKATMAALTTPLTRRVRKIELALERIRWLPSDSLGRHVVVNIPSFQLYAFLVGPGREDPILTMGVIVGQALHKHQTPIFADRMEYLVFRPYWNVPYSITTHELLPKIRRDPEYLGAHDYEIVSHFGGGAWAYPANAENIERLVSGELKLRQTPGPRNALGLVKFILPNANNVYLHSTPAQRLFHRSRRDFSHGCIRVEDPVALAAFVLEANGGWDRERIERAMRGASPKRVDLAQPVPVYILYMTAAVDAAGEIFFYQDIYGHDARLEKALRAGHPYPP